jgi:uncharacterized protein YjdB
LACGAGHPTIQSLQISPASATAQSPQGEVGFTARGVFTNGNSRELSLADNLQWSSSNTGVATIDSNTGQATCKAPGTVTITATAPANLTITVNNGINNTSQTITATAQLICT